MSDLLELQKCVVYLSFAFLAAAVYDFGHSWLIWKKSGRIKHILADTALLSILGIMLAVLIIAQGGIMRWYIGAMIILGASIYHLTIKKLLRKLYLGVFKFIAKLWQIFTFPLRKIACNIKKYYQKIKKSGKKDADYTGNMPLDEI